MKRVEKRRKFHEGLINMLFPPPPSPPHKAEEDGSGETINILPADFNVDDIPVPDGIVEKRSSSSYSGDEGEQSASSSKLTRAQRKRIRRKKLKEAGSLHRKFIGPLMPSDSASLAENESQDVRQNAEEKGDPKNPAGLNQNRVKQRRMAKKLAHEKADSSRGEP